MSDKTNENKKDIKETKSENKKDVKEGSSKAAKKEGKGFFAGIGKFFKEYRGELKKISWPTFSEVVKNTLITLVVVVIVGIIVWLVDWGVSSLRDTLITAASKVDASELFNGDTSASDAIASAADEGTELTPDELADLLGQISASDAE